MILGRVVGTVWCTRKDPRLQHCKLLLIRPYFYYNPAHDVEQVVAVDLIDAGVGDDVVVCLGSPARWSLADRNPCEDVEGVNLPVDAAVLGIVDRCQMQRSAAAPATGRPLAPLGGRWPRAQEWI